MYSLSLRRMREIVQFGFVFFVFGNVEYAELVEDGIYEVMA